MLCFLLCYLVAILSAGQVRMKKKWSWNHRHIFSDCFIFLVLYFSFPGRQGRKFTKKRGYLSSFWWLMQINCLKAKEVFHKRINHCDLISEQTEDFRSMNEIHLIVHCHVSAYSRIARKYKCFLYSVFLAGERQISKMCEIRGRAFLKKFCFHFIRIRKQFI